MAGAAAGVAATIKPSSLLFLAGPAVLLLLVRRWRTVLLYAAGIIPSLLLLALWKQRGLGTVPAFALEEARDRGRGARLGAASLDRYVYLDWDTFHRNMASLREYAYSARVLQWIPFAGAFAVARRSLPLGGLLAGWFGAFLLVKGTAPQATVDSGSFFRHPDAGLPGVLPALRIPAAARAGGGAKDQDGCAPAPATTHRPPHARRRGHPLRRRAARRDRGATADFDPQLRRRSRSTRS